MVSTLLGYRLYASNISKTLERIEATGSNKRDSDYYAANIGKVHSVDDFLDDYRLYSYAMKAYGLEEQIASKGLMRKVLESDLADASSFANKLTDKKYRTFAAAFNFATNAASETKVAQSTAQTDTLVEAYNERRVRQGTIAAATAKGYLAAIGSVRTVDDVLADPALYKVVLGVVGADPTTVSKDFVRKALTGTLPNDTRTSNPAWFTLHEKFNFRADGSIAPKANGQPGEAQTSAAAKSFVYDYNVATDSNDNAYAAAFNTDYFKAKTATLTNLDQLFSDKRLFSYLMTSFGFDPSAEDPATVKAIVLGGDGPNAPINQLSTSTPAGVARKQKFVALQDAVRIAASGDRTAIAAQIEKTIDGYFGKYQNVPKADDKTATSTFRYLLGGINSVTDLLAKNPVFGSAALNYVLKAFDIDPSEASLGTLRRVLTSDVSDPNSYANKLHDERFEKLAAAFNFDAQGKATTQRLIQSTSAQTTTGVNYKESFGDKPSKAQTELIKADTKAYLTAIQGMASIDDFLSDKKTLDYALKAYGLDKKDLSSADVRKILTSDLSDRKSFAYSIEGDDYVTFAQAFNFTTSGTVSREATGVQNGAAKLTTENNFLLQRLEAKAGEDGQEGVRLALYFRRTAPDLKSVTGVLADKALLKVVMTAFSLPDGFSQLDIDKQISILERKLKLDDLEDPKQLDKFISRFAALYDVANSDASNGNNPILQLFGGGSSSSAGGILALL